MQVFTQNSKTILSIDFDRTKTCETICSYCYVANMERIYPAYKNKTTENNKMALENPDNFARQLNTEYRQHRKSKSKVYSRLSKLPVRVYGSGDYIQQHYDFLKNLEFKFYIISKSLTNSRMAEEIGKLLLLPNLTKIVLSYDSHNINNYEYLKGLFGNKRITFAYTGMADEFTKVNETGLRFDIFFNISDKKVEKEKSQKIIEQCPCDSGALAHKESCSFCNKCWRSTITKGSTWNELP